MNDSTRQTYNIIGKLILQSRGLPDEYKLGDELDRTLQHGEYCSGCSGTRGNCKSDSDTV
jgi:hypothetical protein